jgi:hypothetical protein
MHDSSGSVSTSFRKVCRRFAVSSKSAWRAHKFTCALRLPASEAVFVCCPLRSAGPAPSETAGGKFAGRARAFPLRFSAGTLGFQVRQHPPPPNNSFKPTPCRGGGRVQCATLAHVRRPATGRLNSGVRRRRNILSLCCSRFGVAGFVCSALRILGRRVLASVAVQCALRRGQFVLHGFRGQTHAPLRWRFRLLRSAVRLSVYRARPVSPASLFRPWRWYFVPPGFLRA